MGDWSLDLEVDVNGEEIFMVNKRVISSYSGRISKLLGSPQHRIKVVFNDFPGGAANFEHVLRFCYTNGKADISPLNISRLTCAAHFMEMNKFVHGAENLCEKMQKSVEEIKYWSWSELLVALKQCQDLSLLASSMSIVDKCLVSVVARITSSCEISPCPSLSSSSDSSGNRLSCDTESSKNSSFRTTWWFEDLVALDTRLVQQLVKMMVSRNLDHQIISRFLFYYQKTRLYSALVDQKIEIIEMVVEMLESLDISLLSHKSLFGLLRVGLTVNLRACCRDRIEHMIGLQLDQATLDNLLIPPPVRTHFLYDVDLVHRLVKSFLSKGVHCVPLSRLKKVASLIDLYLAEVAPDPYLKPSKFLALIRALPASARDWYDGVYSAVNLYIEVHSGLSEEQKMKVCMGLNYEKLSSGALNHLAQNPKFPSGLAAQAVASQQRKLKSLLQDEEASSGKGRDVEAKQIVVYAKKLSVCNENEMLKAHLQGMQWRVVELEKVCRKMQAQMAKMMKSRRSSAKSVPKLCS